MISSLCCKTSVFWRRQPEGETVCWEMILDQIILGDSSKLPIQSLLEIPAYLEGTRWSMHSVTQDRDPLPSFHPICYWFYLLNDSRMQEEKYFFFSFFSFSSSVSPLVHAELWGFRSSSQYHLKQTPRTASNVSKMTFYFPACHPMVPGPQLTFRMVLPFRPTRWSLGLFTSPAPSPPHRIFVFCSPLHTHELLVAAGMFTP